MSDLGQDTQTTVSDLPPSGGGAGEVVRVDRYYDIASGMPLASLDQPHARAYTVTDRRGDQRGLFALICESWLAPRFDILGALSRLARQPVLVPLAWDTVYWPPAGARRLAIVFEQPGGQRVQPTPGAKFTPFSEDAILRSLIKPMIPMLKEMRARGLMHRAIRADNLFFTDPQRSGVMLGECVSTPAALDQPALYETIENMMANPGGRARGTQADDLYALGVLIAVLLNGGEPGRSASLQDILLGKIVQGSYATLVGRSRLSLPIIEALRGLLCDEPSERWDIEDLEMWANGRHLSPKQPMLPAKGVRPYRFAEADYWCAEALGAGLRGNWARAREVAAGEDIASWIRRSISDEQRAAQIDTAFGGQHNAVPGETMSEQTLARVLIALDPVAPIQFREFSARPESLVQALAVEFNKPGTQKLFAEIVSARLQAFALELQNRKPVEVAPLRKQQETLAFYLARPRPGYGIERCLYEYNDGWPCLSPLLENEYVTDVRELLPALNRVAETRAREREPMDRHIAAFVCARMSGVSERILSALGTENDELMRRLGMVHFFAEVQDTTKQFGQPALALWIKDLLQPLIESYRNRNLRREIAEAVDKAVEEGNLIALVAAVDNAEARNGDNRGYHAARRSFAETAREIAWLEDGGLTNAEHVGLKSEKAAAVIAGCIASVALLLITLASVG